MVLQKKTKEIFKAHWQSGNELECRLFTHLNSFGQGKVVLVKKALTAYFYPEIVYQDASISQNALEVKQAICELEARLNYLRSLLSDNGVGTNGSIEKLVEVNELPVMKSSSAIQEENFEDNDDDWDDEDEDPYGDEL